jgi:glycogen synthase
MRVLFWTEGFWPQIGGLEVLCARLLQGLRARGHEFLVVTASVTADAPDAWYLGIPVHRFPFHRALQDRDLPRIVAIRRRIESLKLEFKPDLVHLNVAGPGIFFHLRTMGDVPTLAVVHSLLPALPGDRGLQDQALRSASWVVGVSASILAEVRALSPDLGARCSVVHNGLPMPALPPTPLPFEPPRLLCLGRLAPEKGFDVALAAFAALVGRFPGLELTIAGDGPCRAALERQAAALGVSHAVRFAGWVAPERTPELLNAATLVVMPSRWQEPFGLVALEAAQQGRPIVATRVGALPEIVVQGETGLLVDNEDSVALAGAIASLLERPDRATRMGEAARRRAQDQFSFERCVAAYDDLYYRTIASARRERGRAGE